MPASLYLALAYLKPKRSVLSVVNAIAVIGTMLAVATLLVVISVMNGFDMMWREKILSFHPHVTLYSFFDVLEEDDPLFEKVASTPGVTDVAPFIQNLIVAQNGDNIDAPAIRGIDPERDFLFQRLMANTNTLVSGTLQLDDEQCLLGEELAFKLGLRVGDVMTAYSPATFAREQEIVLPEELEVVGIFRVGMWQIDQGFVVTTLDTARDVVAKDSGVDGIQVLGPDMWKAGELSEELSGLVGERYHSVTWMQMNKGLFDALMVEKRMMFFILSMFSVVASFLVTSTLIMMSVQKTREVGLLKSFGFRPATIRAVFTWYGLIQGVLGVIAGLILGMLILHFRNDLLDWMSNVAGFSLLPKDLYFLSTLPAKTDPRDIAIIGGLVVVLSLAFSSLPAWMAARKDPVEALRHD